MSRGKKKEEVKQREYPVFDITVEAERTLDEFFNPENDALAQIGITRTIGAQNFMWWQLTTIGETLRVIAVRQNPDRREDGHWDYPDGFRIVKNADPPYWLKPKEIFSPNRGGVDITTPWLFDAMKSPDFISLSYAVGRRTVHIHPHEVEQGRREEMYKLESARTTAKEEGSQNV